MRNLPIRENMFIQRFIDLSEVKTHYKYSKWNDAMTYQRLNDSYLDFHYLINYIDEVNNSQIKHSPYVLLTTKECYIPLLLIDKTLMYI